MGTLIDISNPQQQLRQNRAMLLLIGGVSSVSGLMLWSATPFAASDTKNPVQISLRYFALLSSLGCGITAIATGHQLQRITPLIKAVEAAEKNDFLTQLASSQYVQEQQWQQTAVQALQPPPATEPQPQPQQQMMVKGYKPLYLAVTQLQSAGVSDSKIIKEVLKQDGQNLAIGQQTLATLLQLGQQQKW